MSQPPIVPIVTVLRAVRDHGAHTVADPNVVGTAADRIVAETGRSHKQAFRAMEKCVVKGWLEYGTSLNWPWLTDTGITQLQTLEQQEKP